MPTHRDEPRCESEGQLYYLPCIIRKHTRTHTSCEAHLGWSRPIPVPTAKRSSNGDPQQPGARSHAAQGYEPQVRRTAAMAVALLLGSGS